MDQEMRSRRVAAVKAADAINAIEGAPVSGYARRLSALWARGRDHWRGNEIRFNHLPP